MINYDYLEYWKESIEKIRINEHQLEINLNMYRRTKDIKYLEQIKNNSTEIIIQKPLLEIYYHNAFSSNPEEIKLNTEPIKEYKATIETIKLQKYLLKSNLETYLTTANTDFLEYMTNNIKEIKRLDIKEKQQYEKAFIHQNKKQKISNKS